MKKIDPVRVQEKPPVFTASSLSWTMELAVLFSGLEFGWPFMESGFARISMSYYFLDLAWEGKG